MKALVVGGDGKLARVLCTRLLDQGHTVVKTTRRSDPDAPVRQCESIMWLDMLDPRLSLMANADVDVVYIMAAVTGVVPAERHPHAWRINAEAPLMLSLQARNRGWHVVFPSSGTVELAPHTASAMQKAYADHAVLMCGGCVVRLLPFVRPEWYAGVVDLLIKLGIEKSHGVVRWGENLM